LKSHDFCGKALCSIKDLVQDHIVSKSLKLDQESGTIEFSIIARNFSGSEKDSLDSGFLSTIKDPCGAVIHKLENSLYASQFKTKDDLKKFAEILSDPEKLRATYLSTKWTDSMKLQQELSSLESDNEEEQLIDTASQQLKQDIKVKIVVVDQDAKSAFKQNLRKLLSPVLSKIEMVPTMGMFHTALMIGPWLIEWNNSALCIPRKCVSRAALLSADVDAISSIKSLDTVVDNLSKAIIQWNVSKGYKTSGGSKQSVGNCQDFIESILNAIGIKLNFQGPLAEFLKEIKDHGTTKLEFKITPELREKFKIQEKSKVFETHHDLDEFIHMLFDKDPQFDVHYKYEYAFMKSFDRAFWMRHFKINEEIGKSKTKLDRMKKHMSQQQSNMSPEDIVEAGKQMDAVEKELISLDAENKKVQPCIKKIFDEEDKTEYDEESCPFKDPRETKSIIV
jgi:hypothetical protein